MLNCFQNKLRGIEIKILIFFNNISKKNYFTNVYGLGRSLLAFGTLITLLFNSKHTLFPEHLYLYKKHEINNVFNDINLFFLFDYNLILISQFLAILILLFVILGYYPRITGLLHWWVSYSYFSSTGLPEGGDQLTTIITLILIPITIMDNRQNHWKLPKENNEYKSFIAFLLFLTIKIQMAVIYFHAATEKIYKLDLWVNGTALYYYFNDGLFGLSNLMAKVVNPIINSPTILFVITWSVVLLELLLFAAFFMSNTKQKIMFKLGVLFHFFIVLFHGLVSFFFAMYGGLVFYLLRLDKQIDFNKKYKWFFEENN
jgi:antimicrobial peptide system SdpB family protein